MSGWYDQGAGDFQSVHNYFRPLAVYRDRRDLTGYARLAGGRAFTISEFGGVVHAVADHSAFAGTYGYGATDTPAEWRTEVHRTLDAAAALEGWGFPPMCTRSCRTWRRSATASLPTTGG